MRVALVSTYIEEGGGIEFGITSLFAYHTLRWKYGWMTR